MKFLTANLCMSSQDGCTCLAVPIAGTSISLCVLSMLFVAPIRSLVLGPGLVSICCNLYMNFGFWNVTRISTCGVAGLLVGLDLLFGPRWLFGFGAILGFIALVLAPLAQTLVSILRRVYPPAFDEAKEERLLHFCNEILPKYDVVCLQEVVSIYGFEGNVEQIREAAAKHGLIYSACSGRWPKFPALFLSSGLLIVSRYPIIKSEFRKFSQQAFFEWFMITRGALMAEVEVSEEERISFVTVHTTCGMQVVEAGTGLDAGEKHENNVGMEQILDVLKGCQNFTDSSCQRIFCGDFNLQKTSNSFSQLEKRMNAFGMYDCYPDCPPTFGCDDEHAETMLTPKVERRVPKVLDHVFSDKACEAASVEMMLAPKHLTHRFQQVSDHRGLELSWCLKDGDKSPGTSTRSTISEPAAENISQDEEYRHLEEVASPRGDE